MSESVSKAYHKGYQACMFGNDWHEYPPDSPEAEAWENGYQNAQSDIHGELFGYEYEDVSGEEHSVEN
jgi:hypothetical protein